MVYQIHGDNCLSRGSIYNWYMRFQNSPKNLNNDEHVKQPKSMVTDDFIETMRWFIEHQIKSAIKLMEMELGMFKTSIYSILRKHFG